MTEEFRAVQPRILAIDDEPQNLILLRRLLEPKGFEVIPAQNGAEALEQIAIAQPDVILLDIVLPDMNGLDLCEQAKQAEETRHVPIIVISGARDQAINIRAFEAGADEFIQKPFDALLLETRIRGCLRTKTLQDQLIQYQHQLETHNEDLEKLIRQRTNQLERTQHATVFALARLAESRDPETGQHIERIRRYAELLSHEMAKSASEAEEIDSTFINTVFHACPLHDIGKVGIPDRILLKPGKLNEAEFDIMKDHSTLGGETLDAALAEAGDNALLAMGRDIAYYHHERWDGTGYPKGLSEDAIPLAARIVALADTYDALVSKRPYKEPFSHQKACSIILEGRGNHYDPQVVEAFEGCADEFSNIHRSLQDTGKPTRLQQIIERLEQREQAVKAISA